MNTLSNNPYRSPQSTDLPICFIDGNPQSPVLSSLVQSRVLFRQIKLEGRWRAELVWSARGVQEYVQMNGQIVASGRSIFRSIPHFGFIVQTGCGQVEVEVDVRCVWIYFTRAFRVKIGRIVAYQEGEWGD